MTKSNDNQWFANLILGWYKTNGRHLPWREGKNAYKIWLSEIILQQTQVAQGLPYYLRFTESFPTVTDLANASEDEVLKLWQGLGYYSRARNLHAAAKTLLATNNGQMPVTYEGLHQMKGVGDYTAADIAALAYGLPYAAIDGNGYRVLSRTFGIETPIDSTQGKKEFAKLGAELISKEEPGDFNQGMMDLGATVCTPKNPECNKCPLADKCFANQSHTQEKFPIKEKKTKVRDRYFYYFRIKVSGERIVVKQRTGKDIWEGLFDFPLVESDQELDFKQLEKNAHYLELRDRVKGLKIKKIGAPLKHQLSHQTLHATLLDSEAESILLNDNEQVVSLQEFDQLAIPKLIERLIDK